MRCSTVPRFKYLPFSAPALSTKNVDRASVSTSLDDVYSRNSWRSYKNDETSRNNDAENSSLGVAAPFLKSFIFGSYYVISMDAAQAQKQCHDNQCLHSQIRKDWCISNLLRRLM